MSAILRNFVGAVVRTHSRGKRQAMITIKNQLMGFLLSCMGMSLRFVNL